MTKSIVSFDRVTLQYDQGRTILSDVSIKIPKGSFHYLMGPSGAGKSSFLKLIYSGWRDYRGTINVFGQDLRYLETQDIPEFRQQIGVVFQDFYLLDHLNTVDNVALPLRLKGLGWPECRRRAAEMMDWIGLSGFEKAMPQTLSGGQKQRAVIARSVINKPRLLLADEPTGNVDDENAAKLLYLFDELNNNGITVIMATHNRDLTAEFPHPCIHINDGELTVIPVQDKEEARKHA